MKLLLDTHSFIWWITDDERLPTTARRRIGDPRSEVFVSAVTAWEIAVKSRQGRLDLAEDVERFLPEQITRNGFKQLPVHVSHALADGRLPAHHADPFDRLLIAQAMVERMTIVSGDRAIQAYDVPVVWE